MIIHQLLKRGEAHPLHCEDYSIVAEKDDFILAAVFDGCSSGIDSHFASSLTGKIYQAKFLNFNLQDDDLSKTIKKLNLEVAYELKKIKKNLILDTGKELLTTIVLFLYHKTTDQGIISIMGDGVVSVNGTIKIIDQNNMPDYLAYYLDDFNTEDDFFLWYEQHALEIQVAGLEDVSISTDGILSFASKDNDAEPEINELLDYLLKDDYLIQNKSMLGRKCNILNKKQTLRNMDDLGIIRIVKV